MRKLVSLLAAILTMVGVGILSTGTASAFGAETLGCIVNPSSHPLTYASWCTDGSPSTRYTATFQVANETGSYSYAWSVPSPWSASITSGCTSSTDYCSFTTGNASDDNYVSVTLTQGSNVETLTAELDIEPWCGNDLC